MAKHKFSSAERFAIYMAHGMKCYMCTAPLDLGSMVVDHVVPEWLLANPELLYAAKTSLGLSAAFEVNSFDNWMPACALCNEKKGAVQFSPTPLVQLVLQRLAEKAPEARRLSGEIPNNRRVLMALNTLERAVEKGHNLDSTMRDRLSPLLVYAIERGLIPKGQGLRVTQSFRLIATSVDDARHWGATHWSMPPRDSGEPALVVLFCCEQGPCVECGLDREVFQPINQEGGGDPICRDCLSVLDWMQPILLGDLPTHVTVR